MVRELALAGCECVYIASEQLSTERTALGWGQTDISPARLIVCPDTDLVLDIIKQSAPESVHVIAGARGTPLAAVVRDACRCQNRRVGIITESPDPRGIFGSFRRLKYWYERVSVGGAFDFIFAMGTRGCDWFEECGYESNRIFPYAYVTEWTECSSCKETHSDPKILYVGQIIRRKGVDILLQAFSKCGGPYKAHLTLVGDGPLREQYSTRYGQARDLSIDWLGVIGNTMIPQLISDSDVLVLPSREDGWGAVVNESLTQGTPVICSSSCGAAVLIGDRSSRGTVFKSEDVAQLETALMYWVGEGRVNPALRRGIRSWVKTSVSPKVVARYFRDVICHVYHGSTRPTAPWIL